MTRAPRTLGAVTGAGLAAVLAACGGGGGDGAAGNTASAPNAPASSETTSGAVSSSSSGSSAGRSDAGSQGLVNAGETVLQKVGSGTVISVDLEQDDTVWEVQIATSDGSEIAADVSEDGKEIVSGPQDKKVDADDKAENRQEVNGAEIDYKEAARTVLEARSGRITELNLDDYNSGVAWEADVRHNGVKYEVDIDAASGKVLKNERD